MKEFVIITRKATRHDDDLNLNNKIPRLYYRSCLGAWQTLLVSGISYRWLIDYGDMGAICLDDKNYGLDVDKEIPLLRFSNP